MRMEISKLHTRLASTMLYVTHDQVEAMTMGDRIVVMKDGVIQQVAPPMELYDRPANQFVAGFIGSPQMNFFAGRLEGRGDGLWFVTGAFALKVEEQRANRLASHKDKEVVFGIRPEDIGDAAGPDKSAPQHQLKAKVEVIEPMGAEIYLYLVAGTQSFVARVGTSWDVEVNQELALTMNMKKAHFFAAVSGEAL